MYLKNLIKNWAERKSETCRAARDIQLWNMIELNAAPSETFQIW
jgi:hypothetical protein